MPKLLLVTDDEAEFLRRAIEAWSAVYAGDRDFDAHRPSRAAVLRKLDGKYTTSEKDRIAQLALELLD